MKKIIFFVFLISLNSCLGVKKITEKNKSTKQVEKTEAKKDSVKVVKTNRAIKDKVITEVVSSGNKDTDDRIDEILAKLNTRKTSGGNSYKLTYDRETRELVTDFIIAQTHDQQTATNESMITESTFEEKTDEYLYKKITALPWWAYLVIAFLLRKQIIGLVGFFVPGISSIKTIKDIINTKDDKT